MEESEWRKLRGAASRLLAVRGFKESAELLIRYPFQIHDGDNDFDATVPCQAVGTLTLG